MDTAVEALRLGATDYLTKPVDVARLKAVLANVKRRLELRSEIGELRTELRKLGRFGQMIGVSPPMQKVYDLIARVAPTQATVLLTGESGTGKEMAALTVHELSTRRGKPYLPVNCGSISANLIESELFGHERGSFTGAERTHHGYFERASGGTVFLDEIGDMPIELQVKLLRVLETSTVLRVGGDDPVAIDVRVIAASNRRPEDAVAEGRMREDLLYRLQVFPIHLPPLRERGEDIELLANAFLDALNVEAGTNKRFSAAALARMRGHSWPGNVRELKNLVQRAFILAEDEIDPSCLPCELGGAEPVAGPTVQIRIGTALDEVDRRLIVATLKQCGGDKRKAAAALGISLKTLYNRLKQYGAS